MPNPSSLAGKTVIITGASSGVGAATARVFAKHRSHLVLIARGKAALDKIVNELSTETRVLGISMDASDQKAYDALFEKSLREFGTIDILINNAGLHMRGPVVKNSPSDLAKMVDVNLRAPIELSARAIDYMKKVGGGAIINVGSLAGRTPLEGAATYAATKAGLRAFTYSLADELDKENIKVAIVSPGPIRTDFIMKEIDKVEDIVFSQPMSSPERIADAIIDLILSTKQSNEISIPYVSGFLTTLSYLSPFLRRNLRPYLYKKGKKAKAIYRNQ